MSLTSSTVRCLRSQTLSLALSSSSATSKFTSSKDNSDRLQKVFVTEWGCEPQDAQASIFYFGGMPSSATYEVPLHSIVSADRKRTTAPPHDIYRQKGIHLIYIDKPGFGGTDFDANFSIRDDWPRIVSQVADHLLVSSSSSSSSTPPRYGIMGVSNGGPYVMACLTASDEAIRRRVTAAACIVGVSDVWASGYFGWSHPSGMLEGIYNSFPTWLTGPYTWLAMQGGKYYIQLQPETNAVAKLLELPKERSKQINELVYHVLSDSSKYFGRGAQLDCQQTLSPVWARPLRDGLVLSADTAYRQIQTPVSLWYGRQDTTIPLASANWLAERLPNSTMHVVDGTHSLYFQHADAILDDLLTKIVKAKQ